MRSRSIGVAVLLVLGTLFWTTFGLGLWAKRQALDTNNWVDTSAQLLENEQIRSTLAFFIVDQLYDSAAVQARLEKVLPPRLQGLAAPAAAGLKEVARRNAPRVLGSAAALKAWESANRAAHSTLLDIVDNGVQDRSLSLNLKSLVGEIAAGTGLPANTADKLPPNVANIQIASPEKLDNVRQLLHLFKTVVWLLLGLAVACFAGAIALAADRRKAVVKVGGCLMFAAIAILAFRTLAGKYVVESLADAPNAHAIAGEAWDIATRLMVNAAQGSFLFGLLRGPWGVAGRAGPARDRRAALLRLHVARACGLHAGRAGDGDPAAGPLGAGALDAEHLDDLDLHGARVPLVRADPAKDAGRVPRRAATAATRPAARTRHRIRR